jgi:2-polyprenyl-6-methoxyphenol hydroxylase-like FAD-dependent oxidoreductase
MAGNAVVVGGGLAGMLAVRALLGHADTVTVVERDRYPDGPEFRKGVPQARHLHIFMSGGIHGLEGLLPGAGAALAGGGAHRLEIPRDLLTRAAAGWQRRFHEGRHTAFSCTRPLLDHVVRDQVLRAAAAAETRVEILQATEVIGLLGTADRVTGVRTRGRDVGRAEQELAAELVLDASGRASSAPKWLAALGRPAPHEETVDAGLAYATRLLRLAEPPDAGVYIQPAPGIPRGGVLLPVEGGDWIATLYGVRGHHPPTDEDGFFDFTATLADPYLHHLMKTARPSSAIHGFRNTSNRRRHYHAPGGVPEGLVVLADAACTFNPVYGQGMSVAVLGALALRDTLDGGGLHPGLAADAQRAVARAAEAAWLTAVAADRPYASQGSTTGTLTDRLRSWYFTRLSARACTDPVVGAAFRDVVSLTAPPTHLVSPRVALRTILLPRASGLPNPPLEVEPATA